MNDFNNLQELKNLIETQKKDTIKNIESKIEYEYLPYSYFGKEPLTIERQIKTIKENSSHYPEGCIFYLFSRKVLVRNPNSNDKNQIILNDLEKKIKGCWFNLETGEIIERPQWAIEKAKERKNSLLEFN